MKETGGLSGDVNIQAFAFKRLLVSCITDNCTTDNCLARQNSPLGGVLRRRSGRVRGSFFIMQDSSKAAGHRSKTQIHSLANYSL